MEGIAKRQNAVSTIYQAVHPDFVITGNPGLKRKARLAQSSGVTRPDAPLAVEPRPQRLRLTLSRRQPAECGVHSASGSM
jgi:hypothetical protein